MPVLGSNPFAAAVPAGCFGAFVLDIACTAAAVERIVRARELRQPIPEGWALDSSGSPTTDPAAALASLEERTYDAGISDFLMPEMDGLRFLKKVREIQPFASRILLTGYADKRNAIRSINEVGLYHYIEKPWDNDYLILHLRNALERAQLLRELDDQTRVLAERDEAFAELRARLLKAIL